MHHYYNNYSHYTVVCNKIHSFWSPPALEIHVPVHVCASRICDGLSSTCISTCPFDLSRSTHFQWWLGVSNQAVFKAYNATMPGEVPAFRNLQLHVYQLCHGAARDSELKDYTLYWSIHDGGPRKEPVDVIPLCCYFYWIVEFSPRHHSQLQLPVSERNWSSSID